MKKNFFKNLFTQNQNHVEQFVPEENKENLVNQETQEIDEKFIPEEAEWIRSHYIDCINQTCEFSGFDFEQAVMLDVGCGDCLTTYGFLNLPIKKLVGLDIIKEREKHLNDLPNRIANAGLEPPKEIDRFKHVYYDGRNFPFGEETFDFVFSWSAFEHVGDVDHVLSEIYKVLKQTGLCFVQVYPWYPTVHGSHLTDFIKEDFFHLKWNKADIKKALDEIVEKEPEKKNFILGHLWQEFLSLNGFSADMFYRSVQNSGFKIAKARLISFDQDLRYAPATRSFSELMIMGTMMLLEK